jgi:hypothetical protein
VTDESIKRQKLQPVTKAMLKLVNQNVKFVDSVALAAIASAVTATAAACASWSTATAAQILTDVAQAKANILALNQGYEPDTRRPLGPGVGSRLRRVHLGRLPAARGCRQLGGLRQLRGCRRDAFLPTPNLPTAGTVLVVDSTMIGGMADENLGGPGYNSAGPKGVEGKSIRDDRRDQWRLRMRRVTVPVVTEPAAGRTITGV